jgi:DnaJ-class molecular chaperone
MWQKCPICNGSGNTYSNYSLNTSASCRTCNGTGMINEITGLPPIKSNKGYDFRDEGDFRDNCEQFEDK